VESPQPEPSEAKVPTEEARVEAAPTKARGLEAKSPARRGTPKEPETFTDISA